MDTAAHLFHADERADIFVEHHTLFFVEAGGTAAITYSQVLQLTLATLVAYGAIKRVVDEQKLHDRLLRLDGTLRFGVHDHALRHRRCTSWHGFGGFFDIDQTHAAIGRNAEFLVIAKMRNESARLFGSLNHHTAFGDLHCLAVDLKFNHVLCRAYVYAETMQVLCVMWCSNSGRKCLSMPRTGMAAASPSAQIVLPMMFSATLSSKSMSAALP